MSFDPLARHYRWMERVLAGETLQQARIAWLDRASDAKTALILGEGNGRFLVPFLEANRRATAVCADASREMLRRAERAATKIGHSHRVEFLQCDVLNWHPPERTFDLIVTHFFLDCFTEEQLARLIPRFARAARPGCLWLLADFQIPSGRVRRIRATIIHRMMYLFFRLTTQLPARRVTPPDGLLQQQGFRRAARKTAEWELIRSDCWILATPNPL